jgi:hypothetical protein
VAGAHSVALELGTRKPECTTIKVAEQGTMGFVTLDDTESPSSGLPGSPVSCRAAYGLPRTPPLGSSPNKGNPLRTLRGCKLFGACFRSLKQGLPSP